MIKYFCDLCEEEMNDEYNLSLKGKIRGDLYWRVQLVEIMMGGAERETFNKCICHDCLRKLVEETKERKDD
jgi:hypothetical protein